MKWKRMKGISSKYHCWKCGRNVDKDEFDLEEDLCYGCEFPEASGNKPAEYTWEYGDKINKTHFGQMIDRLDEVPEKQSKQAKAARQKYFEKTYTYKRNPYK